MDRFYAFDEFFIRLMRRWGIPALRAALGIVFIWFGALKIAGVSPVEGLVQSAYSFLPYPGFFVLLGIGEAVVGAGLLFRASLRPVLALLWLQMLGVLAASVMAPSLFFIGHNIFLLTMAGEFLVKNLVLIASSMVIAGYEVVPKNKHL